MTADRTTVLCRLAVAHGFDYTTALIAASTTALEFDEAPPGGLNTAVEWADEIAWRLLCRCRALPITNELLLTARKDQHR